MKQILLMIALVGGCGGKKEPVQPSAINQTPPPPISEASNPTTPSAFEETKAKAEAGDANAQNNLGGMYYRGEGVEKDFKEAVKWYQKAADQGDAAAQLKLGLNYFQGQGVLEDYVVAYAWSNISASNGNAIAKRAKAIFTQEMTQDQIAEGQKLSREMIKKNPKLIK